MRTCGRQTGLACVWRGNSGCRPLCTRRRICDTERGRLKRTRWVSSRRCGCVQRPTLPILCAGSPMATDNLRHEAPGRVVDACLLVYASTTDPTRGRGERNESDVRDRLDTDDAGEKNTYRLIKHGGQRMHAALRLGDSQSTRASGVRPSSTSTAQQAAILRPLAQPHGVYACGSQSVA